MSSRCAAVILGVVMALADVCPGWAEETLLEEQETREHLGFHVDIEAAGEHWHGQMLMTHETWLNGSTLLLSRHFDVALPESIAIPVQEEVKEENGVVMSLVSLQGQNEDSPVVRMHEYGTFAQLGALVGRLAEQHTSGRVAGYSRPYLSGFLLLNKPASIRDVTIESGEFGKALNLAMSDDSVISYHLDSDNALKSLQVIRDEITLTYTVVSVE